MGRLSHKRALQEATPVSFSYFPTGMMAITAVSKPQPSRTAKLICVCQGLLVWKGRCSFDSRKTFPLPFMGSGWGGLLFIPAKRNSSGVLERQGSVGTGHARILRHGTASWNSGDVHPGDRGLHIEEKHVYSISQWIQRLGKHKDVNIQGAEGENHLHVEGREGSSPKPRGWLWSCSDKPSLPAMPIT